MSTVILKTNADTLPGVVKYAKHALHVRPTLTAGDTILIAQTLQSLQRGEKQICYRMTYVRVYPDQSGETDRIWGRHWRYMIEGKALKMLRRPFNIAELQLSSKNYGQGGPFVYLDLRDEEALRKGGYFDALRDG